MKKKVSVKHTVVASPMVENLKSEMIEKIEAQMDNDQITQAEVARRIGALRNNINGIMRGKLPVSLDFLIKIAESIGLDVKLKVGKLKD